MVVAVALSTITQKKGRLELRFDACLTQPNYRLILTYNGDKFYNIR